MVSERLKSSVRIDFSVDPKYSLRVTANFFFCICNNDGASKLQKTHVNHSTLGQQKRLLRIEVAF